MPPIGYRPAFFIGPGEASAAGPNSIRLDLGADKLFKRFDKDTDKRQQYMEALQAKLMKAFPKTKIEINLIPEGNLVWYITNNDGTALFKCQKLLASVDNLKKFSK